MDKTGHAQEIDRTISNFSTMYLFFQTEQTKIENLDYFRLVLIQLKPLLP